MIITDLFTHKEIIIIVTIIIIIFVIITITNIYNN